MTKKAFTLIELVAVLVILAILSLIVAPLIFNTVRNIKISTNKRSVDGYGRAVEYAMADYQSKHSSYTDDFSKLDIDYTGNRVECDITRINPDYSIYLSECKVNGKYVKDDKSKDGYYHYGILKMTNIEYVDTYGKYLEEALKDYYEEHNEYPSDYTVLNTKELNKEVACDVDINPDGTVYLNNCKVDNENVVDDNNEIYVYGNLYATTVLLKKTNSKSITTYTDGDTHEMYTFSHEETIQTPALTDYRYIGSDPHNYVTFNGDEIWRIIGIFDVDDGTGKYKKRVKLIRNESLGNKQWDSNNVNEWVGSTMQVYLNDDYIIEKESKALVANSKYYLAGRANASANGEQFYVSERSGTVSNANRSKNWIGNIALMYTSDYIFTYALGVDDTCYNTPGSCNGSVPSSGWLYKSSLRQWTLMTYSNNGYRICIIHSNGNVSDSAAYSSRGSTPVVYLKPNVRIKSGDGTSDNPYQLEM